MTGYYLKLSGMTLSLAAILYGSESLGWTSFGVYGWLALGFFVLITLVATSISLRAGKKSNGMFISGIMGATGVRMLLCLIFIVIYWVVAGKRDYVFIFYFFILYLLFTMFEITFLVHKLRADKKDGSDSAKN